MNSMSTFRLALALVFAQILGASVASADAITRKETVYIGMTGNAMMRILSRAGYKPSLSADNYGDPTIHFPVKVDSSVTGIVVFYGCDDNSDPLAKLCTSIQYSAEFGDAKGPISTEDLDTFNADNRFMKVYFDEDTMMARYDVNLDGGVTEANMLDDLDTWETLLGELRASTGL